MALLSSLFSLALFITLAVAAVDKTTNDACLQIEKELPGPLHFPVLSLTKMRLPITGPKR
jgi:hypothetical protein